MPEASGKWWLEPIVQEFAEGFTAAELRRIRAFILANQEQLIHAWNQHFPAPPAPRR
jgi:hypothetical protein